jgi:SAM-dependent methyltransferase
MAKIERPVDVGSQRLEVDHPGFSRLFEWLASSRVGRSTFDGLRRRTAGEAEGRVLEVGAGAGHNFAFYDSTRVASVEAVEPDATMLDYARRRAMSAPVPITLTQAPAESLPFPDASFDTAVVTMVFCSVGNPQQGLREIMRVLKPGGRLLMAEHVRSGVAALAGVQTAMVPLTTTFTGNCHWNRDTEAEARRAGFVEMRVERKGGGLHPIILVEARKSG